MIYYFSGTGNSQWVAEQLALATGDCAINLIECEPPKTVEGQTIGLAFPVYAWGMPEPVTTFAKQLMGTPAFAFGVCTCGADAGNTMEKLCRVFSIHSQYSIIMPNNYVIGSNPDSSEVIRQKIFHAKERIEDISQMIARHQSESNVEKGRLAWLKSSFVHYGFEHFARTTKPFYVTDSCISCGLCAKNCPTKTISIVDGKPVWGTKCYQCTSCINRCPVQAIQYGKDTLKRGRYVFPENGILEK